MTALRSRARTAESFLAELGIVGTVMAAGLVVFLLVVGLATFDAWPNAGALFSNDDSTLDAGAADGATPASSRAPALPSPSDRGEAGGGGDAPGKRQTSDGGGQSSPDSTGGGSPSPGSGSGTASPSGSSGGGGASQTGGGSGSVGQSVSGVGNQVGNAVNGATGTNAGNSVSGAGNTAGNAVSGLGL
jgi:hypothetical protein